MTTSTIPLFISLFFLPICKLGTLMEKGPKNQLGKTTFSNSTNTSSKSCSLLFQTVFSGSKENSLSPITYCKFQGSQLLEAPGRRYPSLEKLSKSCLAANVWSQTKSRQCFLILKSWGFFPSQDPYGAIRSKMATISCKEF